MSLLLDPLGRQRNEIDVCILTLVYTNIYNLISIYKYLPTYLPAYLPTFIVIFLILIQHPRHLWVYSTLPHHFCLFILFMGFSKQGHWSGLPVPSPVDHILPEISTMTCPSWVALHGVAHSFIELDKVVVHVISLIQFTSVAQLCLTLCNPWTAGRQASLSITNSWSLLKANEII